MVFINLTYLYKEYYQKALERLKKHQMQASIFSPNEFEKPKVEQLNIF